MEVYREYVGRDGSDVEWAEKPLERHLYSKSFADMCQIFQIMMEGLNFSHPFKIEIEYDPERVRTIERIYMPKKVFEQYNEKLRGNPEG